MTRTDKFKTKRKQIEFKDRSVRETQDSLDFIKKYYTFATEEELKHLNVLQDAIIKLDKQDKALTKSVKKIFSLMDTVDVLTNGEPEPDDYPEDGYTGYQAYESSVKKYKERLINEC